MSVTKLHHNALRTEENTVMSLLEMMDARLQSPFTALVVGPTSCGKTELLLSLIANAERVATPRPVEIDYCYGI